MWAQIRTFFGEKEAQNIYSVMSFVRGIGNTASGPISVALLMMARAVDRSDYAFGRVSACCLYAGVCMAFSALLGGVGFSAFTHEEKTQKQKMGADTGSFVD